MKSFLSVPRISQVVLTAFFSVFFLTSCSDIFLEPERQPANLIVAESGVIAIIGEDFELNVKLVDDTGQPFEVVPAWVDTIYTGADGSVVKIINDKVVTLQSGVTDLGIKIAGLFENVEVRVAPRLYITQSVQRLNRTLRLIAKRDGVIRFFLQKPVENINPASVTVKVYQNGSLVETLNYPAQRITPREITDNISVLDLPVPGRFIQPGLSILVVYDGITYPEEAPAAIDVQAVPEFHIRLLPIHVPLTGKTGNVNSTNVKDYLEEVRDMFPLNEYVIDLHPPITVDGNPENQSDFYHKALERVRAIWLAEGQPDYYYYGVIPQSRGGIVGLGYVSNLSRGIYARQAVGWDRMPGAFETLAHELGHNFGRLHVACDNPDNPDPNYPYPNGSIGTYGYEVDESQLKPPFVFKSFMSYCSPTWISDYTYEALLRFHLAVNPVPDNFRKSQDVLLVWGRMNNGELILEPAFRISAPPKLPEQTGPYSLSGYSEDGSPLFSISFAGTGVSRGNARHFAFAIPVERVNIKELETIRLTARGGLKALQHANVPAKLPQPHIKALPNITARQSGAKGITLKWSSSRYKMALVKNANTGEVLGFTSGGVSEIQTDASELKLYFSDGVHTTTTQVTVQ